MKIYQKPLITEENLQLEDVIAISCQTDGAGAKEKSIGGISWE